MSGVTLIKIGDIVDPRTFWAHENKKLSKSNLKLRSMESRLKEAVSGLGAPVTIPTKPGSAVAVRHEDRWVRGRLEHVFRLKKMTATVFLIDYGVTVRDILVADDVRSLEQQFLIPPPLAFQVILSGLYPLSMSMEWDIAGGGTMAPGPARDWALVAFRQGRYFAENARRKIIILSIKITEQFGKRSHGLL